MPYLIRYLISVALMIIVINLSMTEPAGITHFARCTTPNRIWALCIYLEDCKHLFQLATSPILSYSDRLFLTLSQCGYHNGRVLICCQKRHRKAKVKPVLSARRAANKVLPQPGECGNVSQNRIYGGNITKIDEYPWMTLIEYTKPGGLKGHHCGGSLINKRYVLTASHCVNGRHLPSNWQLSGVRLGEWNTTSNPDCVIDVRGEKNCAPPHMNVPVEQIIPHPNYDPSSLNQLNDIALLRLKRKIEFTDFVRPICLPITSVQYGATFDDDVMDVAGWGKTESASASSVKLKATVMVTNLDKCRDVYRSQGINISDSQLCAGGQEGIDSCRGDSGGPLISLDATNKSSPFYFLFGVVSFGPTPCGLHGWPGVYTRVDKNIDWIVKTIEL